MKANELMTGDWVMLTDPINNGEKVQVKEIHGDGYITVDGAITKMFEPIPLTAEILEKNGWRKPPIDYDKEARSEFWTCDCDWIIWEHHGFMLCHKEDFVGWGIELTYVHELQHALRLCNIETLDVELGQSEVTKTSDQELESKKLDVDDVIAWLVANIIDFEYYVKLFKKDFGL